MQSTENQDITDHSQELSKEILVPLPRHQKLYFQDGSLVLLADNTLFRVYGGLLSTHSEVFSDMLTLSHHQPPNAEIYDGCPLVRLSDTSEELDSFLSALLGLSYILGIEQPIPFPVVAGILRLSTKYMVQALRNRAITHLSRAFPIDLREDFSDPSRSTFETNACLIFGSERPPPHPFTLVSFFREFGVDKLLPFALYQACEKGLEKLISGDTLGDEVIRLSANDTRIAIIGWQLLRVEDTKITFCIFESPAESDRIDRCHCPPGSSLMAYVKSNILPMHETGTVALEGCLPFNPRSFENACDACLSRWKDLEKKGLKRVWDGLPAYFELPSWEELRRC